MRKLKTIVLWVMLLVFSSLTPVSAATSKSVMLEVDGMTCRMCPITVRRALERLDGVIEVEARYQGKGQGWARVTYDPDAVGLADITRATEQAGYPSRPVSGAGP